jgi:hypothetical protein
MKYAAVFLLLAACADERNLAKTNPVLATGTLSVFVATILGLSK